MCKANDAAQRKTRCVYLDHAPLPGAFLICNSCQSLLHVLSILSLLVNHGTLLSILQAQPSLDQIPSYNQETPSFHAPKPASYHQHDATKRHAWMMQRTSL